jgi:malate dehydrogenase (oxaloacetate-decarboxylating)
VISGAGAGGAGVAWIIENGMIRDGLTPQQARERVFVLDSVGLLYQGRSRVEDYKQRFLSPASCAEWAADGEVPTLMETIINSKCTVLLGLSGMPGQFTEPIIRQVATHCERPIIFPLSNPTSSCEALPADIYKWTNGKALVASGSPFPPVEWEGKEYPIGQGNNAFVFPGLGAGAIIAGAKKITDNMIMEGSYALVDYVAANWLEKGRIYPPVRDMRKVSIQIATRVIQTAIADKVATGDILKESDIEAKVRREFWQPIYPHVVMRAFGSL